MLDLARRHLSPSAAKPDDDIKELLKRKNPAEKLAALRAEFESAGAVPVGHIPRCISLLRRAPRQLLPTTRAIWISPCAGASAGTQGPFEIWQAAGWNEVAGWIDEDIAAGASMSDVPLPAWVKEAGQSMDQGENRDISWGVHTPHGSYSPATNTFRPRSALPVYRRQPFPDRLLGERAEYGETIFETDAVRMWHTAGEPAGRIDEDGIAILSFKSRMHAIGSDVLDGVQQAVEEAERNWRALVIWQTEPPFSAGANLQKATERLKSSEPPSAFSLLARKLRKSAQSAALKAARSLHLADALMAGKLAEVEAMVAQFQQTSQDLRYSMIPTVAAVDGLALGGGCEFVMHCDRAVATLESYIGLVEAGVGLLPAGGGCKELALRAAQDAKDGDLSPC